MRGSGGRRPPQKCKNFRRPRGGGEGKEMTTQTAPLTLYRYRPFSGTKNGVHLNLPVKWFDRMIAIVQLCDRFRQRLAVFNCALRPHVFHHLSRKLH